MQSETKAALFGAVLAALATMGATVTGAVYTSHQQEAQRKAEHIRLVQDQRQKLLERLSATLNSKARAERLRQLVEDDAQRNDLWIQCQETKRKNAKSLTCQPHDPMAILPIHKEYVEMHSTYASTMQLSKLSFSPRVVELIEKILAQQRKTGTNWWAVPSPDFIELMKAMHEEIVAAQV